MNKEIELKNIKPVCLTMKLAIHNDEKWIKKDYKIKLNLKKSND